MSTPDEILDAEEARLREDRDAYRIQFNGALDAARRALSLSIRARSRGRLLRAERLMEESHRQRDLARKADRGMAEIADRLDEIAAERGKE